MAKRLQPQIEARRRPDWSGIETEIEIARIEAMAAINPDQRGALGQFMTPAAIALYMANLFEISGGKREVRVLDPGAGSGSLSAAFVSRLIEALDTGSTIQLCAYEIDDALRQILHRVLDKLVTAADTRGIKFTFKIETTDFLQEAIRYSKDSNLLGNSDAPLVDYVITNPPYKKLSRDSSEAAMLRKEHVESTNLYSAFVAIGISALRPSGQIVAITPRSFCNGPYFKPFRKYLLDSISLKQIHVFQKRDVAFGDDEVLQENVIFYGMKGAEQGPVVISSSPGLDFDNLTVREACKDTVVYDDDPESFIHIPTNSNEDLVLTRMQVFSSSLESLNLEASTGRVVDFRATDYTQFKDAPDTAPLLYPFNFKNGLLIWPVDDKKKPNYIKVVKDTEPLLMPAGNYVLVRRFSSKEEHHRIDAALCTPELNSSSSVGFENHLNVFHCNGAGIDADLARGLMVYLSSTLVDMYFRHFNGHTQVNATDLRFLRYPSNESLKRLGACFQNGLPGQEVIDAAVEMEAEIMTASKGEDPVVIRKRIEEALVLLEQIGMPNAQQNERSALTLLALGNLSPDKGWSEISQPMIGITPIMEFCHTFYGREYAPNTRETFRRQTMHQFVQAGFVLENPDEPLRPTNSPKWCYQLTDNAIELFRTYGTPNWRDKIRTYFENIETLKTQYEKERKMQMVPIVLSSGNKIELSPGAHSDLTKEVLDSFAARYAPGSTPIYVGDTGAKWAYFDKDGLAKLGVTVDSHGKMPDVVLHFTKENWLLLVEVVTSHGPVNAKRHIELAKLFKDSKAGLVYVTAFPTRAMMARYIGEVAWETEVWAADAPTHLIHFNGERFLGPY